MRYPKAYQGEKSSFEFSMSYARKALKSVARLNAQIEANDPTDDGARKLIDLFNDKFDALQRAKKFLKGAEISIRFCELWSADDPIAAVEVAEMRREFNEVNDKILMAAREG